MEMEKSFYVVSFKQSYLKLLRDKSSQLEQASDEAADTDDAATQRMIVALTQGGFGQDVVDEERQVKERFLEYLFFSSDLDLPRTAEVFDDYFDLEQATEFVDLDEEL
jgi:hypothetical protein